MLRIAMLGSSPSFHLCSHSHHGQARRLKKRPEEKATSTLPPFLHHPNSTDECHAGYYRKTQSLLRWNIASGLPPNRRSFGCCRGNDACRTYTESRRPAPDAKPHKSIINIFLAGGPPHQDMWEIKTEAPSEVRGEFQPIPTNVCWRSDLRGLSKARAVDGQGGGDS